MTEEGKIWQENMARSEVDNQKRYAELLGATQDFGEWADGLKLATEKQFHEMEDRMVQLISDNSFLMNRITPVGKGDVG